LYRPDAEPAKLETQSLQGRVDLKNAAAIFSVFNQQVAYRRNRWIRVIP
jgi:hypothetical protein